MKSKFALVIMAALAVQGFAALSASADEYTRHEEHKAAHEERKADH